MKMLSYSTFSFLLLLLTPFTFVFGQMLPEKGMEVKQHNFTSLLQHQQSANIQAWKELNDPEDYAHPEFGYLATDAPCENCVEVLSKRKVDERYFLNISDHTEYYQQKSVGDLHQMKNGRWITIDHTLDEVSAGIFESTEGFEPVGLNAAGSNAYIKTPSGLISFNNWSLFTANDGVLTPQGAANWSDYTIGEDGAYITNVFPGIDAELIVFRGSVKTNFILRENLFGTFDELIFRDRYETPFGPASLAFSDPSTTGSGLGELTVLSGMTDVLHMTEGVLFARNGPKDVTQNAAYRIDGNAVDVVVPFSWIDQYIDQYELIVDPLVTGTATLAQASITGSRYNGSCNFTTSCDYTLAVARPANSTVTNVAWTFTYSANGSTCWLQDGGIRIAAGACTSPATAGYYWFCNAIGGGTCAGTNQTIFGDVASCMPAPSCADQNVTFTLRFYRSCWGATGCSNACIGAASPWTMTITGNTLEYTTPVNPITVSSATVCAGGSITASSSGSFGVPGYTYNWSFSPTGTPSVGSGASTSITFPTAGSITLYCIVTDACGNQSVASRVVTVTTGPTITVNSATICAGGSAVLTATGGTTYLWTPATGLSSTTLPSVTASPGTTTVYTVTGTTSGCSGTATATVTVNTPPAVTITQSAPPAGICPGGSSTLTANATGGGAAPCTLVYTWSPATGLSSTTGQTVIATPTVTTTYTVTVTGCNGCGGGTASTTVTVLPVPVISATFTNMCNNAGGGPNGPPTASGNAASYAWYSTTTGAFINSGPVLTGAGAAGTYTVVGTSVNGCTTSVVTSINPPPVINLQVNAGAPVSVCSGQTVMLTPTANSGMFFWNASPTLAPAPAPAPYGSVNVTPTVTTTYTVNAISGTCGVMANVTVVVLPNPVITVNSPTICAGSSATLTASGATNYTWTPSGTLSSGGGASVTATPATTTIYTITGTTGACSSTATSTVTVNPQPTITVNSPTICTGGSATLTASGATTYSWSPATGLSSTTLPTVTATPAVTTTYTVTGTTLGCTGTATSTVTVTANPVITVNSPTLCPGGTATLTATGAANYTWSPATGLSSTVLPTVTANPVTTTTYTVTGTTAGCSGTATSTVTVNPTPVITVNSPTICAGASATLTATGATTYTWSPAAGLSSTVLPSVTASPATTTTYTVTGTTAGCTGTATSTVTVNPNPVVAVNSAAYCAGGSATLTATGATTYTWSPATGLSSAVLPTVTANPATTTTYTVTGTTAGCTGTATSTVTVNPNPALAVNSATICDGASATLTATGATTYTWSPATGLSSTTVPTVTASPAATTTYTITGTLGTCTGTATSTVTVNPNPVVTVNSATYCAGGSAALTAAGANTYTWSPATGLSSAVLPAVTANPSTTTTYTVTGTTLGCTGTVTSTVTVNANPVVAVNNAAICAGFFATLNATGATDYVWTPATGLSSTVLPDVTASPSATTTYTVTGTTNGCSGTANATVTVNPNPVIAVNSPTICAGSSTTLTATGATNYTWSPATGLSSTTLPTVTANPSVTTTYSITGTTGSCSGTTTATITVNPLPTVTAGNNGPLCPGDQLNLTATGNATAAYAWSGPNGFSSSVQNPVINAVTIADAGAYTVLITENGCSAASTTTLAMSPGSSTAITAAGPFCANDGIVALTAATPGGTWTGNGITNASTGAFDPSLAQAGTTTITYDLGPGSCSQASTAIITVNALPVAGFSADVTSGCAPLEVELTNTTPVAGQQVGWSFGDGSSASSPISATHDYTTDGCFTVTMTVTDAAGCSASASQSNMICVVPMPHAAFTPNPDEATVTNPEFFFVNQSSNAVSYEWFFGDGGSSAAFSPEYLYDEEAGSYEVILVATNAAGCHDTASVPVKVIEDLVFFIPNSFTPNGDERNNTFQPVFTSGFDPTSFRMLVFNRWGETMFESANPDMGWDGTYHDRIMPEGAYTWSIEFRAMENDKRYKYAGTIILMK